jgi:hypothetical protein
MSLRIGYNTQKHIVILQKSQDNREKLAAMELFKDTHLVKLELLSNATIIDSALNYIRSKQKRQSEQIGITNNDSQLSTKTGRQTVF